MRITITILLFLTVIGATANDTLLKQISFGKGKSVIYGGAGRIARYKTLRFTHSENSSPAGTPFFIFGSDHCFYPKASNAYLGIGPYVSFWSHHASQTLPANLSLENGNYFILTALKISHHYSYFVRKRIDVSTGYLVGTRFKYKVPEGGVKEQTPDKKLQMALGITATVRYYPVSRLGIYVEAGIGYNISLPNIGLCYQLAKKN